MLYNVPIECHSNACCSLVFQKCWLQGGSNGPQFMILFATLEVVFSWPDLVSPWGEIPVKDGIIQTPEASHTMTAHPWTSRAFLVSILQRERDVSPFPSPAKSTVVRENVHGPKLPRPTAMPITAMPSASTNRTHSNMHA